MGSHAAISLCGTLFRKLNFLFGLLEYKILSLRSFETSRSTHLKTYCHNTEHLVADHTSGLSPKYTGPQHELGKHFSFFYVRTLLGEGFSDPATFSDFTLVPPGVSAIEFITRTRSVEVSFCMYFSRSQLYECSFWKEACTTFGYNVCGLCFITEKLIKI